MDWLDHHRHAESLMFKAGEARRSGDLAMSASLLRDAADAETAGLRTLTEAQAKTWAVTVVSIASLYFQAGDLHTAEQVAAEFLVNPRTTQSARERLRDLLNLIWRQLRHNDDGHDPTDCVMVALDDGDLDAYGISLAVLAKSTQNMKASLVQTAALRLALPFKSRHTSKRGEYSICDISVDAIDDYTQQYSLAVREPRLYQLALPDPIADATPRISKNFFDLISTAVESPNGLLPEIVPSQKYRRSLLRSFRDLAPTGHDIELAHIHSPDDSLGIELDRGSREHLSATLALLNEQDSADSVRSTRLRGTLIGLDLPSGSIKLHADDGQKHTIIVGKMIVAQYLEQVGDREVELIARNEHGQWLFEGMNPPSGVLAMNVKA